jgi:hypothetical protein
VPDQIKEIFGILSTVASDVSSFKPPKNIPKGSGRKGDPANPNDRSGMPKSGSGSGSGDSCPPSKVRMREEGQDIAPKPPRKPKPKKRKIPASQSTLRIDGAKNTLREQSCVADKMVKEELVITSLTYAANAVPTKVQKHCDQSLSQACFHYSSAIRVNPHWETLTCPPDAAITMRKLQNGKATAVWQRHHHSDWWGKPYTMRAEPKCDVDEYPPAYILGPNDEAYVFGSVDARGQLVRYLPRIENQKAGQLFKQICFSPTVRAMSDRVFRDKVALAPASNKQVINKAGLEQMLVGVTVDERLEFSWDSWGQAANPPKDDGLEANRCWCSGIAAKDPGFAILTYDPWYQGKPRPYDYKKQYFNGVNGE